MKKYIQTMACLVLASCMAVAGASPKEDFFRAVRTDNAGKVRELIASGFDPNQRDERGQTGLLLALRESLPKVVEVLVDAPQTDVDALNDKDESPLMLAAFKGQEEIVVKLIDRDAAVNKPGWTPLHYAATNGHLAIIQLLLEHYAFIDAESPNGTTPLMMAAGYGSAEAVQLLLSEGADPTMKNQLGLTAVDFAVRASHPNVAERITAAIQARRPDRKQW